MSRDKKINSQFSDALYYSEVARAYRALWLAIPGGTPQSKALCGMWYWSVQQRKARIAKLLRISKED